MPNSVCREAGIEDMVGYAIADVVQNFLQDYSKSIQSEPPSNQNLGGIVSSSLGQLLCLVVKYKINEPLCHKLTTSNQQPKTMTASVNNRRLLIEDFFEFRNKVIRKQIQLPNNQFTLS